MVDIQSATAEIRREK